MGLCALVFFVGLFTSHMRAACGRVKTFLWTLRRILELFSQNFLASCLVTPPRERDQRLSRAQQGPVIWQPREQDINISCEAVSQIWGCHKLESELPRGP